MREKIDVLVMGFFSYIPGIFSFRIKFSSRIYSRSINVANFPKKFKVKLLNKV